MARGAVEHWDRTYARDGERSWYQAALQPSLAMIEDAGVRAGDAVLDVGAGSSALACTLAERGLRVTALDLSARALDRAAAGPAGDRVEWVVADFLSWEDRRRFRLIHDRAVFHFLTSDHEREAYGARLRRLLGPGGDVVVLAFAEHGPESCSGLPTVRYDAGGLAAALGRAFRLVDARSSVHRTPAGTDQPFTCVRCRLADGRGTAGGS